MTAVGSDLCVRKTTDLFNFTDDLYEYSKAINFPVVLPFGVLNQPNSTLLWPNDRIKTAKLASREFDVEATAGL